MKGSRFTLAFILLVFFCFSAQAQENAKNKNVLKSLSAKALYNYLNHPDTTIHLASKILAVAQGSKDTYYEGYSYFLLSKAYWVKANYRLSTEYGFKALRIFENTSHKKELALSFLSLARTLTELGNYSRAAEFTHEALRLGLQAGDEMMEAEAYREYSYLLGQTGKLDS